MARRQRRQRPNPYRARLVQAGTPEEIEAAEERLARVYASILEREPKPPPA